MRKTQIKSQSQTKRIAIIGGGWAGLYALKTTQADGHRVTLFEQEDDIGGVWCYREDKPGGVWRGVHVVSSKTYLHASDFPMPDHYPLFPHHTQIMDYLRQYADHFDLWPHICLNHRVEQIMKKDGEWLIITMNGDEQKRRAFDAVIVCVGETRVPSFPSEEMYKHFTGQTMHSNDYKYPTEAMHNKNILVVGGGESASDIANEVSDVAQCVYMSLRRGRWFMDRLNGARLPLDTRFSRKARFFIGDYGGNFVGMAIFDAIVGLLFGAGGHGIDEWLPSISVMRGFVNKSRDVLQKIAKGLVIPRSSIRVIQGQQIWFEGYEEPINMDFIIYATGFQKSIPFLPNVLPDKAYKWVFYPNDSTLAFLGTVRPAFGSVPALAELQARWISAVFSGRCSLPSPTVMRKTIEKDQHRHSRIFTDDHARLPYLVSHFEYADYILQQLDMRPNFLRLFFTDIKKWHLLLSAPWTPFEALLTNPEQGQEAYENIRKVYVLKKSMNRPSLLKFMLVIITLGLFSILGLIVLIIQLLL